MPSIRAFRVELLSPAGRTGPTGHATDELTCRHDPAHSPPAPRCTCGIYATDNVSSLATILESCELTQTAAVIRAGKTTTGPRHVRLAVVEGDLADPVRLPGAPDGRHRRTSVTKDGLTGFQAFAAVAWAGARTEVRYGVHGDPPGTWRGSAFTPTRAVLQAQVGDDHADLYREVLDGVERVCVEVQHDPARLLSMIVKRYAASGRTDDEWWTA